MVDPNSLNINYTQSILGVNITLAFMGHKIEGVFYIGWKSTNWSCAQARYGVFVILAERTGNYVIEVE